MVQLLWLISLVYFKIIHLENSGYTIQTWVEYCKYQSLVILNIDKLTKAVIHSIIIRRHIVYTQRLGLATLYYLITYANMTLYVHHLQLCMCMQMY